MKVKALKSFCGTPISMKKGETKEIKNEKVAKALLVAKLVEQAEKTADNSKEVRDVF